MLLKKLVWSEGDAKELQSMFNNNILPLTGHLSMDEIESLVLLKVIRNVENRAAMERTSKAQPRAVKFFDLQL